MYYGALHKLAYYLSNTLSSLVPCCIWRRGLDHVVAELAACSPEQRHRIRKRVEYYNRLQHPFSVSDRVEPLSHFCRRGKSSAYYYDFRNLIRHLNPSYRLDYQFGDVTWVPDAPQFVKSRPIGGPEFNDHSVLLKLNTVRHYRFYQDARPFEDKTPMAVWRGKSNQQQRIEFARRYSNHPLCDVGCTLHKERQPQPYHRAFMSVREQLSYQFIVSVEGIDVATNLKWIMASNSLCLMRRPRFETWFMEGTLEPGVHYVELNDDYSDLAEKVAYYRQHPKEAKVIVANANRHVAGFLDVREERLVSLLVIEKFLRLSGQRPDCSFLALERYGISVPG